MEIFKIKVRILRSKILIKDCPYCHQTSQDEIIINYLIFISHHKVSAGTAFLFIEMESCIYCDCRLDWVMSSEIEIRPCNPVLLGPATLAISPGIQWAVCHYSNIISQHSSFCYNLVNREDDESLSPSRMAEVNIITVNETLHQNVNDMSCFSSRHWFVYFVYIVQYSTVLDMNVM